MWSVPSISYLNILTWNFPIWIIISLYALLYVEHLTGTRWYIQEHKVSFLRGWLIHSRSSPLSAPEIYIRSILKHIIPWSSISQDKKERTCLCKSRMLPCPICHDQSNGRGGGWCVPSPHAPPSPPFTTNKQTKGDPSWPLLTVNLSVYRHLSLCLEWNTN